MKKEKRALMSAAAVAGFLLMMTEVNGSPWAGTYIGAAIFAAAAIPMVIRALRKSAG